MLLQRCFVNENISTEGDSSRSKKALMLLCFTLISGCLIVAAYIAASYRHATQLVGLHVTCLTKLRFVAPESGIINLKRQWLLACSQRKVAKIPLLFSSSCVSIRSFACNNSRTSERIFIKFYSEFYCRRQ
jgi:hypothetical protein